MQAPKRFSDAVRAALEAELPALRRRCSARASTCEEKGPAARWSRLAAIGRRGCTA